MLPEICAEKPTPSNSHSINISRKDFFPYPYSLFQDLEMPCSCWDSFLEKDRNNLNFSTNLPTICLTLYNTGLHTYKRTLLKSNFIHWFFFILINCHRCDTKHCYVKLVPITLLYTSLNLMVIKCGQENVMRNMITFQNWKAYYPAKRKQAAHKYVNSGVIIFAF